LAKAKRTYNKNDPNIVQATKDFL
jgi:hypothetical protein